MAGAAPAHGGVLRTERLILRPWQVGEASLLRELWTERDPRVPPHRRIDASGRPTVADLEETIRTQREAPAPGLLAVQPKDAAGVVGYCGLVARDAGAASEPELAFELLCRAWGRGYATEASRAVLDWARAAGHTQVWATVWSWNAASRRVLAKLGFTETDRSGADATGASSLVTVRRL